MTEQLDHLFEYFGKDIIDIAIQRVATIPIEVPSWGFGRGGTRFGAYKVGTEPVTPGEKIAAAGQFHKLTGKGSTIALHFPWDGKNKTEVRKLKKPLKQAGIAAGSINANLFSIREKGPLTDTIRFGSLTHPHEKVRDASVKHCIDCLDYMRLLGSNTFVLWLPDGTNSPGQMSMYEQSERLEDALLQVSEALVENETMLIEYKIFEPGFYSTAIQDYGRSLYLSWLAGDNAKVLVDLGHHPHGVNVEQIIAQVVRQGKLGGFHFNDSYYADDDLATGSLHPHQLFRIFVNLIEGEMRGYVPVHELAFMIDQSHNIKDPFEELIESVENIETAYVKAMLVDYHGLEGARAAPDPTPADRILMDAFNTDVRPILYESRRNHGLPLDPLSTWRETS